MIKLRVKEILKEKGMTQKGLADSLGMTEVGLSKSINEEGNPPLKRLEEIANVLNVAITDLFDQPKDGTIGIIRHNGKTYEINSIEDVERVLAEMRGEGYIPEHKNIRGKEYFQ